MCIRRANYPLVTKLCGYLARPVQSKLFRTGIATLGHSVARRSFNSLRGYSLHLLDERIDMNRGKRYYLHFAAGCEVDGQFHDHFVVICFQDVHEIVGSKKRVLAQDIHAPRLYSLIHLFDTLWVLLYHLPPLLRQFGQHYVDTHLHHH